MHQPHGSGAAPLFGVCGGIENDLDLAHTAHGFIHGVILSGFRWSEKRQHVRSCKRSGPTSISLARGEKVSGINAEAIDELLRKCEGELRRLRQDRRLTRDALPAVRALAQALEQRPGPPDSRHKSRSDSDRRVSKDSRSSETLEAMRFWIVVQREHPELLQLIQTAFNNREVFSVIEDRREYIPHGFPGPERRRGRERWNAVGFAVCRHDET